MNTQVVLITGGLTGIGRATALAFAKEGAQVVVSGRRDEEGQKLVSEIRKTGAEAEFIRADVRREEDVRNLIDKTVERFGRLDVAVNTAGTEGVPGPVTEQTADSYTATFDTNVLGTLLSMKHELRVMLPHKNGSIVNISSTYGHTGAAGASVYSASKHAVEGLTKSAALEAAGTGVRVNVIAPGPIETPMLNRFTKTDERKAGLVSSVPLKRAGKPEEIAQAIVFVSSDKASFITGASYLVDGRQNGPITLTCAADPLGRRIKMNEMIEEKSKELVLKAFDAWYTGRPARAERPIRTPRISRNLRCWIASRSWRATEGPADAIGAHFFDDLQTLNRLADLNELSPSLRAYAQIGLFTTRFDLQWLVVSNPA